MPRAVRSRELAAAARDQRVMRALADATRRRILQVLGASEMRVVDLAARFDISRPAVSKHLRVLKEAGLVRARKVGRERHYAIVDGPLRDAAERLRALDEMWREGMEQLGKRLADEKEPRGRP